MKRALWCLILLGGVGALVAGYACVGPQLVVNRMDAMVAKMVLAVNKNSDLEIVREGMPASLIQLDGFLEIAPDNRQLLLAAAEAYYGYTAAFVEDEDPRRATRLYHKAFGYASRALGQHPEFRVSFEAPLTEFRKALAVFDKTDVPALFWTASTWLSWVGQRAGEPETFVMLPKIEALLKRCVALDESYNHGSAHTCLGAFYASRSPMLGGDMAKARQHFDRAFVISKGKLLALPLMYAKYYAYQQQDRDLYLKTLQGIVTAPGDLLPERSFINEAIRQKAARMLRCADTLF